MALRDPVGEIVKLLLVSHSAFLHLFEVTIQIQVLMGDDLLHKPGIFSCWVNLNQIDGSAASAETASPANTVHIRFTRGTSPAVPVRLRFEIFRHVVVDDQAYCRDINTWGQIETLAISSVG